jgi:hypothetical protein
MKKLHSLKKLSPQSCLEQTASHLKVSVHFLKIPQSSSALCRNFADFLYSLFFSVCCSQHFVIYICWCSCLAKNQKTKKQVSFSVERQDPQGFAFDFRVKSNSQKRVKFEKKKPFRIFASNKQIFTFV